MGRIQEDDFARVTGELSAATRLLTERDAQITALLDTVDALQGTQADSWSRELHETINSAASASAQAAAAATVERDGEHCRPQTSSSASWSRSPAPSARSHSESPLASSAFFSSVPAAAGETMARLKQQVAAAEQRYLLLQAQLVTAQAAEHAWMHTSNAATDSAAAANRRANARSEQLTLLEAQHRQLQLALAASQIAAERDALSVLTLTRTIRRLETDCNDFQYQLTASQHSLEEQQTRFAALMTEHQALQRRCVTDMTFLAPPTSATSTLSAPLSSKTPSTSTAAPISSKIGSSLFDALTSPLLFVPHPSSLSGNIPVSPADAAASPDVAVMTPISMSPHDSGLDDPKPFDDLAGWVASPVTVRQALETTDATLPERTALVAALHHIQATFAHLLKSR